MSDHLWQQAQDRQMEQARELAEMRIQLQHLTEAVQGQTSKLELIITLSRDMAAFNQRQHEHHDSIRRAYDRIEAVEEANATTRASADKWINRGVGAWCVGAILFGVIQALLLERVRSYENGQRSHTERLDAIDRRLMGVEYVQKARPVPTQPKED